MGQVGDEGWAGDLGYSHPHFDDEGFERIRGVEAVQIKVRRGGHDVGHVGRDQIHVRRREQYGYGFQRLTPQNEKVGRL